MAIFSIPVRHYMSTPVHTIRVNDSLRTAQTRLHELDISCLAVVDADEQLAGVISRTDLLNIGDYKANARKRAGVLMLPIDRVSAFMTRHVHTVGPDDTLHDVCRLMVQRQVHRVFVVDGSTLAGVFSTQDVMTAIRVERLDDPLYAFMSRPLLTVQANEFLEVATARLLRAHITGLVVVEDDWPIGVFTQVEALQSRKLDPLLEVEEVMSPAVVCMPEDTRLFRAADQAQAMGARRVIACANREPVGILSGLDFAHAIAW